MPWTTPMTYTAGSVLTAAQMNTYVRDNTTTLPRGYIGGTTLATDFSTSSTSYVDVTNLSVTFTAEANRRYLITLYCAITNPGAVVSNAVINDGTNDLAEAYTLPVTNAVTTNTIFAFTTPAAGSVTYKARLKAGSGTSTMYGVNTRASLAARLFVVDVGSTV